MLGELQHEAEQRYIRPELIALLHLSLGDINAAFEWLDRAYQARSSGIVFLILDRRWDPIREDPRFRALLKRVGLGEQPAG